MNKVKILVACHKPGTVYHDDIYTPIHVGRAVSKYKEEMVDMIGDDTGDNISEKNSMYCELTAQYWAWKNLHDVEYIGFCHYRRFWDFQITQEVLSRLLIKYDVIALKRHFFHPLYMDFLCYVSLEDFTILLMVIKKKYPDYEQTVIDYFYGNKLYLFNMFICRKELFDQYAEWLFDILFECEKHMKPIPYSRARRALAYMGEYLMAVYMIHNHKKTHFVGVNKLPAVPKEKSIKLRCAELMMGGICGFYQHVVAHKPTTVEDFFDDAVIAGFIQDQIDI